MAGLQFTAIHVRGLLGLTRTDLQRWLNVLPPFDQAPTQARTARRFAITDLAFFSLVALLHRGLGLPVTTIAQFSASLYDHVNRPSSLSPPAARLFLNQGNESGVWVTALEPAGCISISIDPEPVWKDVYAFIGLQMPVQRELALGLVSVNQPPVRDPVRGHRAS